MKCPRCDYERTVELELDLDEAIFLKEDPDHDCVGRRIMRERLRIVEALRDAGLGLGDAGRGLDEASCAVLTAAAEAIIDIKEEP